MTLEQIDEAMARRNQDATGMWELEITLPDGSTDRSTHYWDGEKWATKYPARQLIRADLTRLSPTVEPDVKKPLMG